MKRWLPWLILFPLMMGMGGDGRGRSVPVEEEYATCKGEFTPLDCFWSKCLFRFFVREDAAGNALMDPTGSPVVRLGAHGPGFWNANPEHKQAYLRAFVLKLAEEELQGTDPAFAADLDRIAQELAAAIGPFTSSRRGNLAAYPLLFEAGILKRVIAYANERETQIVRKLAQRPRISESDLLLLTSPRLTHVPAAVNFDPWLDEHSHYTVGIDACTSKQASILVTTTGPDGQGRNTH